MFLSILMPSYDQAILMPLSMSRFGSLLPKCLQSQILSIIEFIILSKLIEVIIILNIIIIIIINHREMNILPEDWLWNGKDHCAVVLLWNPIQNLKQKIGKGRLWLISPANIWESLMLGSSPSHLLLSWGTIIFIVFFMITIIIMVNHDHHFLHHDCHYCGQSRPSSLLLVSIGCPSHQSPIINHRHCLLFYYNHHCQSSSLLSSWLPSSWWSITTIIIAFGQYW